jgi:hypothetical protein
MALDPVVRGKIDCVVKSFVDEGRMFTAFEVSLAVKEGGVRERHRNMRSSVHESIAELAGDNYTRTLRDVGAPVQAWVYHRLRDNPYLYEPLDRSGHDPAASGAARSLPAAPRNPQPLSAGSAAPATESDGAFGTDQNGRLVIPPSALSTLGLGPGDQVDISCDSDNQEIRIWRPAVTAPATADASATVDPDGKLRLAPDDLKQAELDGMQCYRIVGRGNLITVRDFS